MPVMLRLARASLVQLFIGQGAVERLKCLCDPGDASSLTQRQRALLGLVGLQGQAQHRALLRLGLDDQLGECRDDDGEPLPRITRWVLRQQRVAVSG